MTLIVPADKEVVSRVVERYYHGKRRERVKFAELIEGHIEEIGIACACVL